MARWKDGKPPEWKKCNRCGQSKLYSKDFYMWGKQRKDGTLVWYAIQPCIECMAKRARRKSPQELKPKREITPQEREQSRRARRKYQREYQRIRFALANGRPYRSRTKERDAEHSKQVRIEANAFFAWLDEYLERTGNTEHGLCEEMENTSRSQLQVARRTGYLTIRLADKFFLYANEPQMLAIMEDMGAVFEKKAS